MRCLTGAKFNMKATLLRQGESPVPPDDTEYGTWVEQQDPLTGEIVRVWVPATDVPDDPNTPEADRISQTIPVMARGIVSGGINAAGTTERWGEEYDTIDYVRIRFPANYLITNRDRITNIRNAKGQVIWRDEEAETPKATVFDVLGVTPIIDPFGRHNESTALLQRAEVS